MSGRLSLAVGTRDHVEGRDDALVTLLEYADYECPYCGLAYPVVKAVQKHFGADLRFAFRNFPLTEVHPHATLAAEAAEAAGAQGKFWPMHDALYEHQRALDGEALARYAEDVGVDLGRWRSDLASHSFEARVREDVTSGVRSGVPGTPAFFINGIAHAGPFDFRSLAQAIDAARARARIA